MANITIKDLRNEIEQANRYLSHSGSNYFLREQGRNGYQAVDVYSVGDTGKTGCIRMLEGGSSRECVAAVQTFHRAHYGKVSLGLKPSRLMALTVLQRDIDFTADFHTLSSDQVDMLVTWAKLTKYRKPANANGSTGRYFFNHLAKKVN